MNELFNCLEYIRAYINDLLIISNGNFQDHVNKVKKGFEETKISWFQINAQKSFFTRKNLEYLGYKITR